jgi:transcription-repair coupling factor (superfamily II helicase)
MRAAFKVAESGRQVAVLAPTTLLTLQHFHSFSERFRDYPFHIGMVSRFQSKKENDATVMRLKEGALDIIIGTHRLLSKDVEFKNIGLLVIDEEHKFGVRHKERIKEIKAELDVLTMTATPIPRTLQFSLLGVRDMSLINTPPRNRIPIETRIVEEDRFVLREAILREKARGGQVYYVHNRVETIDHAAEKGRAAVPGVTFAVAHGQMDEKTLEEVMVRFLDRGTDVLVCSAIIESGLDIPNVNTIIVADADRFGLSQLYQLRGRVGRSSIQAYAYLMVRAFAELTDDARRRLKAMEQLTEFGSGYRVAMRDLEIRGAGNLLGVKQHGLLCQVGFEMYNALLQEAVLEIRENRKVTRTNPAVRIETRAFLPADYIPETAQRLEIYHRLSRIGAFPEFDDLAGELKDRFGPLPEPVSALLDVIAVKFVAGNIQASAVTVKTGQLEIQFEEEPPISPEALGRILKELPAATRVGYEKPLRLYAPLSGNNPLTEAKKLLRPLL